MVGEENRGPLGTRSETVGPKASAHPQPESGLIPTDSRSSFRAAQFDQSLAANPSLADLKKLQDPAKFHKARFSFRLYKQ